MSELIEQKSTEIAQPQVSPLNALLADPDKLKEFPIETVERLFALDVEHQKRKARIEYSKAFNAVQADMTPVRKTAKNTQTGSLYAKLDEVTRMLDPIITKHGMSRSLSEGSTEGDEIEWALTLRHISGHEERHKLTTPIDNKGMAGKTNKTRLHGIFSSSTSAERILLCRAFGVHLVDDDDGNAAAGIGVGAEKVSTSESRYLEKLMGFTGGNLLALYSIEKMSDLPAFQFRAAVRALRSKAKMTDSELSQWEQDNGFVK